MAWEFSGGSFSSRTNPYGQLLKSDCIGCHTAIGNGSTGAVPGAPIVYNTIKPNYGNSHDGYNVGLAGGNFYYLSSGGVNPGTISSQRRGHSIPGIPHSDVTGWPDLGSGEPSSCSKNGNCHQYIAREDNTWGCKSCHLPAHHKHGPIVDSEDGYYRFLGPLPASGEHYWGVTGYEDSDWEKDSSGHNEYSGEEKTGYFSINRFCNGCHVAIVDLSEYGGYHYRWSTACLILTTSYPHSLDSLPFPNPSGPDDKWDGYGSSPGPDSYNRFFPIARKDITGAYPSDTIVYNTNNVLSCLTCHRAHASPYNHMLRWDGTKAWADMANEEGCKFCHKTDPRPP